MEIYLELYQQKRLTNKSEYEKWIAKDSDNDQGYYALSEFRFKKPIPEKFIKGYMSKNSLKESPENIPQQPLGLDIKAFSDLKRFKNVRVEEFPLMYKQDEHGYFFAIEIDGENAAFLKAKETNLYGKNSIEIERTYTLKKYRNKGLMTALYYTLAIQGFNIISDKLLSPESRSIWKKLVSKFKTSCFILNTKTKELSSLKPEYIGIENENEVFIFTRDKRSENNDIVREHFIFIDRKLYNDLEISLDI